ncbi:hypothetical protein JL721_5224 [Aureococcus anophagefferens]|nr:hypothetical protein JL721_5224 [Aureococcus anophagefferens]
MATQELRDLKSLFDDGILDEDEYEEKLAEINAAAAPAPPPKKKKQAPPKKKAKAKAEKEGYEGLSVAKLKAALKERGLSQTGEKGTLIWRLKLQDRGGAATLADGRSPFALKVGELKKQAAKVGVSPMGTNDEMLEGLVDALLKANPGASAAAAPADAAGGGGSDGADAREVATRVLELAESDDWESILSLGAPGSKLGALSPLNDLKKAYRKLSRVIHPDKLRGFDGATRAFQALKATRIERSNDGCVRTAVACPRCGEAWGASKNEGLPDYAYNLLMTGLRSYTCSTCLCTFGCVSAKHACKSCGADFDYSPADWHRKIACGDCGKTFGFFSFHVSDRAMNDAIRDARAEHERNAKQRAAKQRRAARRDAKGGGGLDKERSFLLGLLDECPRCGEFFGEGTSKQDKRDHLACCADKAAIARKRRRDADDDAAAAKRDDADAAAEAAQAKAVWEAAGKQVSQLWMLPDAAPRTCAAASPRASRARTSSRAAATCDGVLLLTDGDGGGARGAKRRRLTAESLPSNHASRSTSRCLCAAHGFAPKSDTKDGVLHEIENELHDDKDAPLLLTAATAARRGGDDDDDGDDDFEPVDLTGEDDE